jgi:hypothetical protein
MECIIIITLHKVLPDTYFPHKMKSFQNETVSSKLAKQENVLKLTGLRTVLKRDEMNRRLK